ncbi:hypothetical protein GGI24_004246, partial [Coemansia furcata]
MAQPLGSGAQFVESELEMEMLEQFSDEEDEDACETSYIRRFGDMSRSALVSQRGLAEEAMLHNGESSNTHENEDDEDDNLPDNASVASSCDRGSLGLGLGGSKSSLTKKSPETAPPRQRVFEGKSNAQGEQARPASRGSMMSGASDMAYGQQQPLSSTHSVMSYHTANDGGPAADEETGERDMGDDYMNATVRIKVDRNSIDDDQIDDIFSDSDDIVQHEPSYCHTGSGLSTMSSSGSVTMQSMSNALALASAVPPREMPQQVISAFPVVLPEVSLRSIHELPKTNKVVEQLKHDSVSKESAAQRATSPFLMRDSLYEMIMSRSPSRQNGSVAGSVTSNTITNGSTFGSSKDNLSLASGGPLRSPTSPTTHISPTSTSFDDSNCSPSHTAISSPSGDTTFVNLMSSTAVVPEESAETATGSFAEDVLPAATNDYEADVNSYDHDAVVIAYDEEALSEDALSASSRAASPVPGPRPDAMSLFAAMHEPSGGDAHDFTPELSDEAAVDVDALLESEHERAALPLFEPAQGAGEQFPPTADVAFRAGRIGRRQGRAAAAELMHDDMSSGFGSEPTFNFTTSKLSGDGFADKAAARTDATSDGEPESPLAAIDSTELSAAPDVPLTRDKRDQYLQTLINRNTMRGSPTSSPSKRNVHAGITNVMRAASPAFSAAASDLAGGSGDEGDNENDSLAPPLGYSFRHRHISKRSEGSIEFGASRSSSALGMRDRSLEGDAPRSRPPSSLLHSREALSVSGASINGRMRASTVAVTSPTQQQANPVTPTRKVSPSLAVLKNRSLVSNSPAKLTSSSIGSEPLPTGGSSPAAAARVLTLSNSSR